MIRRFWNDIRGNYIVMTSVAIVPIMGALALAIDYSELSRQRQATMNALDAAGIATARRIVEGATDDQVKSYAKDFFEANLGHVVHPSNATLTIVLPANNTGGGTLKLSADLKYKPTFLPVAAMLIGKGANSTEIDFSANSEIRLKNTLEVALVLDNSGSMSVNGTGTGQKRIDLLKAAAKQLVETLAAQAAQMKQVEKPVQFGLVPFSASVNVGPTNDAASWMDTSGLSPIHHENFDWSKMTAANAASIANRYAQFSGGVWRKRGAGWGDTENQPLTRFSLYQDIMYESDRQKIPNSTKYTYTASRYATWQGCVEARPVPYNNNDATPATSDPATLFVPMFAPDEAKHLWRLDIDGDGDIDDNSSDLNSKNYDYTNNWWADWDNSGATSRQRDMRKYFRIKPYGAASAGSAGPNFSCTTNPITPLKDVTKLAGKQAIVDAIDAMSPSGNTNVPEGTAWGWRVVSSGEPFTEGRPDTEKGNDKVIIVLTDGENTYGDANSSDSAGNKSTYAAYGYVGQQYGATGKTRLFTGTSVPSRTDYSTSDFTNALDQQMQVLCTNAKAANVLVMTVSLDLSDKVAKEKKAIAELKACASESRFRKEADGKPAKLFWNATGSTLAEKFKEIADELSNLRIVS